MNKLIRIAVVLAIVTTACRVEANSIITILEDGSGETTVEIGVNDDFMELLSENAGMTVDDLIDQLGVTGEIGELEQRRDGDMTFFSTSQSFADSSELQTAIDELSAGAELGNIDVSVTDDGASITANVDAGATADLAGESGLVDAEFIGNFFSANVIVTLPGDVIEHNADQERPDGSLLWEIDLEGNTAIEARSEFGGDGFPMWLVWVAVAALLAIGAFLLLGRRRDAASAALAATPAPDLPPLGFDDPPPAAGDPFGESDSTEQI